MRDADTGSEDVRDEKLLLALLEEPMVRVAAKRAGLSEATAYRRLAEPRFVARLRAARRTREAHAMARLSSLAVDAVETLRDVMAGGGDGKNLAARTSAARSILDALSRDREADIAEQLAELRRDLDEVKQRGGGR